MLLEEAIELYLVNCQVKNLSKKTITDYNNKLKTFQRVIGDKRIDELGKFDVNKFVIWMKEQDGFSDVSVASYLRAVRALLYFCMEEELCKSFRIRISKAEKAVKPTYTDRELALLLKRPKRATSTPVEFKIWALESFLLGTGCRIGTAINVRNKDLFFDDNTIIFCKTKNRKQQIVPMSVALKKVLLEYCAIRKGQPDEYLFPNCSGGKSDLRTIEKQVVEYNKKRGIEGCCHKFRHTYAKLSVKAGIDAFRLQKLMGHSDISVTKEYIELFSDDLREACDQFNPLSRINNGL